MRYSNPREVLDIELPFPEGPAPEVEFSLGEASPEPREEDALFEIEVELDCNPPTPLETNFAPAKSQQSK